MVLNGRKGTNRHCAQVSCRDSFLCKLFFGKVLTKIELYVIIKIQYVISISQSCYDKGKRCFFVGKCDIDTISIKIIHEKQNK